jgi:hypothetical protein
MGGSRRHRLSEGTTRTLATLACSQNAAELLFGAALFSALELPRIALMPSSP